MREMVLRNWFELKGKGNWEEGDNQVNIFNAALNLHNSGRFKDAYPLYVKALKGFETILDKYPENTQFQSDVAMTQNNLGALLRNMGRQEEAREMYERALEIVKEQKR